MNRTEPISTPSPLEQLLLVVQFLGTLCITVIKLAVAPGSLLRRLPLARIALVGSMALLIYQEEYSFTIQVNTNNSVESEPAPQPTEVALASMFSFGSGVMETAIQISDKEALALIDRFEAVAKTEQKKFGVDAGVLLAASILAENSGQLSSANNAFGKALSGPFDTAWESWRAMTLSVLAAKPTTSKLTRESSLQKVASLYPDNQRMKEDLVYTLTRFSL